MSERLDGLRVLDVDCLYLTPSRTRCFARGTGPAGPFELPVAVIERGGRPVWQLVREDLEDARNGRQPSLLSLGEPVTVMGRDGERITVVVTRLPAPVASRGSDVSAQTRNPYNVRVRLRNRGSRHFADSPQSHISVMLSDGDLVAPTFVSQGRCKTLNLLQVNLPPGDQTAGCVAFSLPGQRAPARLVMQVGTNEHVLQWDLNGEPERGRLAR